MSYILDALKKSEQQRGHGRVPDVQTIHSSSLNYHQNRNRLWPTILIIAVLLNLLAILYFIYTKDKPATPVSEENIQTMNTAPGPVATASDQHDTVAAPMPREQVQDEPEPIAPAKVITEKSTLAIAAPITETRPQAETKPQQQVAEKQKKEKPAPTVTPSNDVVMEFHELPASTRDELPAIIITAHVYSSNALQRSIVINNNFMEEGEYVIDNLVLDEITPDGAIFDYDGTRFHYGVVSGWQ